MEEVNFIFLFLGVGLVAMTLSTLGAVFLVGWLCGLEYRDK